jgi:hypothetical protein
LIRRIFDDDFLQPSIFKRLKDMSGLLEIERHDFGAFFSDFLLASLRWQNSRREDSVKRHAKNNQRTAPDKFPRYLRTSLSDFHGIHPLVSPAKKAESVNFAPFLYLSANGFR